jgi:nucleoside-diphosphate-sugar epimerase
MTKLVCFGFGYCAEHFIVEFGGKFERVIGTVRRAERAGILNAYQAGAVRAVVFDGMRVTAELESAIAAADYALVSVPPDASGDPVLAACGGALAARVGLRSVVYLSTVGVYGDRGGGWVDESSSLDPAGERGRRRVAAEQAWLELHRRTGLPVHIFRLAGIYGPGRSALEAVRQGRAQRIAKPGHVFSRIHVVDIVAALRASMARPDPGAIYNLADDDPAPPEAVIAYACELLGVPAPPLIGLEEAQLSPTARSFYDDNKRVSNRRIKEALGIRLRYPSYRDGLAALLREAAG